MEASYWSMFVGGSLVAQAILVALLLMSTISWAIIIYKWLYFRKVSKENNQALQLLNRESSSDGNLSSLKSLTSSPLAKMYRQIHKPLRTYLNDKKGVQRTIEEKQDIINSLSQRLELAFNRSLTNLEDKLSWLPIISGSAPYIGLFGTVIGIISAFQGIASVGVSSIAAVAPGISEALVATAAGLFAAIPALIAYNVFQSKVRSINAVMKNFALDLLNRIEDAL